MDSLETLPDGTIIVVVGGVKYRGLNADAMRNVLKITEDYKLVKGMLTETEKAYEQYKTLTAQKLAAVDADHKIEINKEVVQREFWKSEYTKEKELRLKFQGIVDGCSGKIIFFRVCI